MAIITWENGLVPEGMEIRQVYGLIFTEDGRIMLRTEQKPDRVKFSLAGGHPESFDDGTPLYAQVQMTSVIDSILL